MIAEDFEITREKLAKAILFTVKGRVNFNNAAILQYKLEDALRDGHINIIVNMSQVEYLNSSGIRVILKTYKHATEAGGSLSIERPSDNVRNVLGLTALDDMLLKS